MIQLAEEEAEETLFFLVFFLFLRPNQSRSWLISNYTYLGSFKSSTYPFRSFVVISPAHVAMVTVSPDANLG